MSQTTELPNLQQGEEWTKKSKLENVQREEMESRSLDEEIEWWYATS